MIYRITNIKWPDHIEAGSHPTERCVYCPNINEIKSKIATDEGEPTDFTLRPLAPSGRDLFVLNICTPKMGVHPLACSDNYDALEARGEAWLTAVLKGMEIPRHIYDEHEELGYALASDVRYEIYSANLIDVDKMPDDYRVQMFEAVFPREIIAKRIYDEMSDRTRADYARATMHTLCLRKRIPTSDVTDTWSPKDLRTFVISALTRWLVSDDEAYMEEASSVIEDVEINDDMTTDTIRRFAHRRAVPIPSYAHIDTELFKLVTYYKERY
jgi:hypothetical protein